MQYCALKSEDYDRFDGGNPPLKKSIKNIVLTYPQRFFKQDMTLVCRGYRLQPGTVDAGYDSYDSEPYMKKEGGSWTRYRF
jgi:hypothetical protein